MTKLPPNHRPASPLTDTSTKPHRRNISGILLLDKSAGLTSNAALQRAKRLYAALKAGHTGSLDPLATGMLPICFGQATKVSSYLLDSSKTYQVRAKLGTATDTGDADGSVVDKQAVPLIEESALVALLARFLGQMDQIPPMYSALKRDGQPLYRLARRGIEVDRAPRAIVVHALSLEAFQPPEFDFVVHCSKGTYVRSLVVDIAAALGTVGHVTALRRLRVDPYHDAAMYDMDVLEHTAHEGLDALDRLLLPVDSALVGWPRLSVSADHANRLQHGQNVPVDVACTPGRVLLYGPQQEFFGIGDVLASGMLKPRRVFLRSTLGAK